MDEAIKYISKIEIKGLWGRYDLEWNLHPDVNVLSGVNGSGKSTILRYVYDVIGHQKIPNENLFYKIKRIVITFNTGKTITRDCEASNSNKSEKKSNPILINLVKTNENKLITKELVQEFDSNIKTYFDWLIYLLQKEYLNYQINIGKRALQLIESETEDKYQEIYYPKRRFIEILNEILGHTNKKVNETENEIAFYFGDTPKSAYDLSSGEKQILIILLTTLVQDQKTAILLMDNPEVSIHFDIQKKLIGYIRTLNPNAQIILATQSPALIIDGWFNKVSEISGLIISDNQAVLQDAA